MNLSTSNLGGSEDIYLGGEKYRVLNHTRRIVQKVGFPQCYILQEHNNLSEDDFEDLIGKVILEYSQNSHQNISLHLHNDATLNDELKAVHNTIHKSKFWQNIILSNCIIRTSSVIATLCPVPDNISEYKTLAEIARNEDLSIRTKILALDNLTLNIMTIYQSLPSKIKRIGANCIYVNPGDGNVIVLLDRCLDIYADRAECNEDGLFLEISAENGLTEQMLVRFLAYAAFTLLCKYNPFDVTASLKLYPLLTKRAAKEINTGQRGFVFAMPDCDSAENDGNLERIWKLLPSFFRSAICSELDKKIGEGKHPSLKQWQTQIRMLRDSLIIVKNRPVLYDWDTQQNLLLLKCNEYLIPVWPRKAIYWYHVDLSHADGENGIIGGIDAELRLRNNSNLLWSFKRGSKDIYVYNGNTIKLQAGMIIKMGSLVVKVLAGNDIQGRRTDEATLGSNIYSINDDLLDEDIRYMLDDRTRSSNE